MKGSCWVEDDDEEDDEDVAVAGNVACTVKKSSWVLRWRALSERQGEPERVGRRVATRSRQLFREAKQVFGLTYFCSMHDPIALASDMGSTNPTVDKIDCATSRKNAIPFFWQISKL